MSKTDLISIVEWQAREGEKQIGAGIEFLYLCGEKRRGTTKKDTNIDEWMWNEGPIRAKNRQIMRKYIDVVFVGIISGIQLLRNFQVI